MISKFLKRTVLSAVVISAIIGCGSSSSDKNRDSNSVSDSNSVATINKRISPYQRVAILSGEESSIEEIALKISDYVVDTDERAVLGFPGNWVIAGANPHANEVYDGDEDLLKIPVDTGEKIYKSRVIEFCNADYATKAVNTGQNRGTALPCKVAVHSDGEHVYVDVLDADAIFTMFFPNTPDPDGKLKEMATAVREEVRKMVLVSLEDEPTLDKSTKVLGPQFTTDEISKISDEDIYLVTKYKSLNGDKFTKLDARRLASAIISKMGTDDENADVFVEGLSPNSKWRSARAEPIAIPDVFVTEACSPTYAAMATRLGAEYITALPCKIAVYLDKSDTTDKTLAVSVLNPNFMLKYMFKGAIESAVSDGKLTQEEAQKYDTLASTLLSDLNKIRDKAIEDCSLDLIEAK